MKSQDETLEDWCRALLQALELEDVEIDVNEVLALAGVAAHSVVRPAAPLTTFIAGFAAGLASGSGQAPDAVVDAGRNGRGPEARPGLRVHRSLRGMTPAPPSGGAAAARRELRRPTGSPGRSRGRRRAPRADRRSRTDAPGPHLAGGPAARLRLRRTHPGRARAAQERPAAGPSRPTSKRCRTSRTMRRRRWTAGPSTAADPGFWPNRASGWLRTRQARSSPAG